MQKTKMSDFFPSATVEPINGFSSTLVEQQADAVGNTPLSYIVGHLEQSAPPYPYAAASPTCSIRRLTGHRYLQCELSFPEKNGWLEVFHNDVLVDKAELVAGWQHAAVDIAALPTSAELTLVFRGAARQLVDGVLVKAIFLSDTWGKGQRKRLKCYVPFTSTSVLADFTVHPCCALQWLKPGQQAGNTKTDRLADLWNGPVYQKMRADFLAGDYDAACRSDVCPVLRSEHPPAPPSEAVVHAVNEGLTQLAHGPTFMHHDIDYGCNLECVMCRPQKILPNKASIAQALTDLNDVAEMNSLAEVSFSGAGEVFIMAEIIKLLESDYFSSRNIKLDITSNLTHFTPKLWNRISHNNFGMFVVSADGCSTEIYEAIRVGAKWSAVDANMRFLSELRRQGKIGSIGWQYTVQRSNIADVGSAITRARDLGFDVIRLIAQMGTLDRTNGNMFEDYDRDALDQLYDQIESVGGFDDPLVLLTELGIDNRRYRTVERRLELAEYVYDRFGFLEGSKRLAAPADWQKCRLVVAGIVADIKSGAVEKPDALSPRHRGFVGRFLETARADRPAHGKLRSMIRRPRLLQHLYAAYAFERQVIGALGLR